MSESRDALTPRKMILSSRSVRSAPLCSTFQAGERLQGLARRISDAERAARVGGDDSIAVLYGNDAGLLTETAFATGVGRFDQEG